MENASSTKDHFYELHFLPKDDALLKVQKFIEKTLKKESPRQNFMTQLELASILFSNKFCFFFNWLTNQISVFIMELLAYIRLVCFKDQYKSIFLIRL